MLLGFPIFNQIGELWVTICATVAGIGILVLIYDYWKRGWR